MSRISGHLKSLRKTQRPVKPKTASQADIAAERKKEVEEMFEIQFGKLYQATKDLDDYTRFELLVQMKKGINIEAVKDVWQSPALDQYRRQELTELQEISAPDTEQIEEGIHTCARCKCRRVRVFSQVTRGGDEGTTIFMTCTQCNNRWKEG